MLLIWGSRLYGKVDEVPGLFHVATKFGHLWFIPLFPVGASHLVLEQSGDSYRGASVGLSGRSVLAAYLRAWGIVGFLFFGLVGVAVLSAGVSRQPPQWVPGAVVLLLAAVSLGVSIWAFASGGLRRASYQRAVELAERVGLSDEGKIMIEFAYQRISREEFEGAMAQAAADRAELERLAAEQRAARAASAPPTGAVAGPPPLIRR